MILTDTHTHLYYEQDVVKRTALIPRCLDNNIKRLFLPNVDAESLNKVYGLVDDYPDMCFAMLGLHPCSVKGEWEKELEAIALSQNSHKIYAIGEIGIDL